MQKEIQDKLESELNPLFLQVLDTSAGCGESFSVVIVSPLFEGKNTLQRHRFVNEKLNDIIPKLHAFSQKTLTPEEYEKQKK